MEKNQFELCLKVLRRLSEQNLLEDIILIGSWCMPFYKEYFSGVKYFSAYKTRDVDFLVPQPRRIKVNVDIAALLKDLGFVIGYTGSKGYMRLEHEDLVVEFLSPEKGRGTDKPVLLPQLRINAQALRFLNFLAGDIIKVKVEDFYISMPHPATFALHKLIVSQRRAKEEKSEKDKSMAFELLNALMEKGEAQKIKAVFESIPPKWQKKIIRVIEETKNKEILMILKD